MTGLRKSTKLQAFGLVVAAAALSGCVGGTTYGTGVSQEEQTVQDLTNMLTLKQKRQKIDYSPRPDLIVPDNKQALVEPIDTASTTSNPDWPETPEQRIVRIRAQAGEIDAKSGDYSIEEQQRKKEGIGIEDQYGNKKFVPGLTSKDGDVMLWRGNDPARAEVLKAKQEAKISTGPNRRYLTEPPVEYRVPEASAPSGSESFTEEELLARKLAEEKQQRGYTEIKPLAPKER